MKYFTHPLTPRGVTIVEQLPTGVVRVHKSPVDQCDKVELLNLQPASIHSAKAVSTEKA